MILSKIITGIIICGSLLMACSAKREPEALPNLHASLRSYASVAVWVDRINCDRIMNSGNAGEFQCYRIGRLDSSRISRPDEATRSGFDKYWQYEMWKDWGMVVENDTIRPVFYEAESTINAYQRTAILVFENNRDGMVDTLVYTDRFGGGTYAHYIDRN